MKRGTVIRAIVFMAVAFTIATVASGSIAQQPCFPETGIPEDWSGDRWRVSVEGVGVEFADDYSYILGIAFSEKAENPDARVLIHDSRPTEIFCRTDTGEPEDE